MAGEHETVQVEQLRLNPDNPRFPYKEANQHKAIQRVIDKDPSKLVRLAQDLADNGQNPSKSVIVCRSGRKGTYTVLDGNRRATAIKIMMEPALLASVHLASKHAGKLAALNAKALAQFSGGVRCVILTEQEARHWLEMEHTATKDGVPTEPWSTAERHRFQGVTPQLEVVDIVRASDLLDDSVRSRLGEVHISNVERMIHTKHAAERLGVKVTKGKLVFVDPEEDVVPRLAALVTGLIGKPVGDLYTKEQRADYIDDLLKKPLPTAQKPAKATKPTSAKPAEPQPKKVTVARTTLIPKDFVLAIPQPRLNRVYTELQELSVDDWPNSVSVLFRVFMELSIDHYADSKGIKTKKLNERKCKKCGQQLSSVPVDMNFTEKASTVAKCMLDHGIITKQECQGILSYVSRMISDLHGYVHNKDFNPKATDLKAYFDDMRTFLQRLWA